VRKASTPCPSSIINHQLNFATIFYRIRKRGRGGAGNAQWSGKPFGFSLPTPFYSAIIGS
jgi:hypothetical protein